MKWIVPAVIVAALAFSLAGDHGLPATLRSRRQAADLSRDLAALRADNQRLRLEASALRDDAGTIESVARGELGLLRPGEVLFVRAQ